MLKEGLEKKDLYRLIHPELHVDEFKSKLGRDEDVCVLSFKLASKEAGIDLVNFIEKGYSWVIDADVSSGEMDDGDYIVFVECERDRELPDHVTELMDDLMNLTDQKLTDWRVRYHTSTKDHKLDIDSLSDLIPLNSKEYEKQYGHEDLDKLRAVSGIAVKTKAPKNELTESLRIAAGIR
jgi:hypothetical protein